MGWYFNGIPTSSNVIFFSPIPLNFCLLVISSGSLDLHKPSAGNSFTRNDASLDNLRCISVAVALFFATANYL